MKWIEIRNGHYKLVEDDDPRPEVKLKSKIGAPNIQYVPSWKKHETPMFLGDSDSQLKSAEQFTQERDNEVKTSSKAARWERSRRDWYAKQKHNWRQKEISKLKEKGL